MCNMNIGHKQTVAAYHSLVLVNSSPANGYAFTDYRIVSDLNDCVFTGKLQVLGYAGYYCSREDFTILPSDTEAD